MIDVINSGRTLEYLKRTTSPGGKSGKTSQEKSMERFERDVFYEQALRGGTFDEAKKRVIEQKEKSKSQGSINLYVDGEE